MGCFQVHDFITGTTIALPRAIIGQSANHDVWDVLRPNSEAAALVSRHVEALHALNTRQQSDTKAQ
jgi:hypothetical protein